MNKKLALIISFFTLLTLSAAAWLAYEAFTLDTRLLQIDKEAQQKRLVELSIPRVQAEMKNLLRLRARLFPADPRRAAGAGGTGTPAGRN